MHIHGGYFNSYYNRNKRFVEKNLRKCDKIITLSQDWVDFYSSIDFESIFVENVIPMPQKQHLSASDGLLHMLYLGLIIKRKGIYDLLDVLFEHKQEFDGKLMLHIGGNGEVEQLREKIKSQGLENIVKYEGWIANEKKLKFLNICDVFILPSYVEGLPLSILEAMSYNMSVIATPVGGIPSLVQNKINGLLFEPGDKDGLYDAINTVIRKEVVLKSNNNLVENYYPQNVANKLKYIYNSLLD